MRAYAFNLILLAACVYGVAYLTHPHLFIEVETQQTDCGGPDTPCFVGDRRYHILLPEGDGPFPIFLFFHGSGGSGADAIRLQSLYKSVLSRGYALLAPTAEDIEYENGITRANWVWEGRLGTRDDYAFVTNVLRDAAQRFPLDQSKTLVTGHSRGATFIWYYACANTDFRLTAYAPNGGTPFVGWNNACAGKAPRYNILHTHGEYDEVVAFTGTPAGDFYERFGAEAAVSDFAQRMRCRRSTGGYKSIFTLTTWDRCLGPSTATLATYKGGHEIRPQWAGLVIAWFEDLPK